MNYASLDEAKAELRALDSVDNARLLRHLRQVSRRIDLLMSARSGRPYFAPYLETRQVLVDGYHVNSRSNILLLDAPLLSFTVLSVDGTAITAGEGYPQGYAPIRQIRITSAGDAWYSYISNCADPAYASLTGMWGFHSDYANAWLAVDTLAAAQAAGATSFSVADIDGADPEGFTPRLSVGNLIKIDDEFQLIASVNTVTNVATVKRAQHGTTDVLHALGASVAVWQTEEPIRRITARQAALLYAREGAFQVETVDGVGVVSYPQDLLREMAATLTEYLNA